MAGETDGPDSIDIFLRQLEDFNKISVTRSEADSALDLTLPDFEDFRNFEFNLLEELQKEDNQRTLDDYNILRYEELLSSAASLLAAAISLRDDGHDLARALIEEYTSSTLAWVNLNIARESWEQGGSSYIIGEGLREKISGLQKASEAATEPFDKYKSEAKIAGLNRELEAHNKVKEEAESVRKSEEMALRFRAAERNLSGSALNYGQRISYLRSSFIQSVVEAFYRLKVVDSAVRKFYRHAWPHQANKGGGSTNLFNTHSLLPFPELKNGSDVGFIDCLLRWARHAAFVLERLRRHETVVVRRLSIKDLGESPDKPVLGPDGNWRRSIRAGDEVHFYVFANLLNDIKFPRLLGFGLSHYSVHAGVDRTPYIGKGVTPDNQRTHRDETLFSSLSGIVKAPSLAREFGQDVRPQTSYLNIRDFRIKESPDFNGDLENVSPIGKWSIILDRWNTFMVPNTGEGSGNDNYPDEIYIELHVAGIMEPET
ncbi:hypothetical protein [Fluviibacterium sp. S390]|uniref:hypothetical protein n=1 Tax=Fluviibacterium sp. S390 TaxID=3415139 RepID=UPI003C7AB021